MSGLWILDPSHNYILLLTFLKKNSDNALKGNNAKGLKVLTAKGMIRTDVSEAHTSQKRTIHIKRIRFREQQSES